MIHVDFTGYLGERVRRDFPDLRSALDWLWPKFQVKAVCNRIADLLDNIAGTSRTNRFKQLHSKQTI